MNNKKKILYAYIIYYRLIITNTKFDNKKGSTLLGVDLKSSEPWSVALSIAPQDHIVSKDRSYILPLYFCLTG